jgi:hypothetical protein
LPNLARSLFVLGSIHSASGDPHRAVASFREAVELLEPIFLRYPDGLAPLMRACLDDFQLACSQAGEEPDGDLVTHINEALRRIEARSAPA